MISIDRHIPENPIDRLYDIYIGQDVYKVVQGAQVGSGDGRAIRKVHVVEQSCTKVLDA